MLARSHILTLVSSDAETRNWLAEFQETSETSSLCPFKVPSNFPAEFHILISLSAEEEAINCPFGLNLTQETPLRWDLIVFSSVPVNLWLFFGNSQLTSILSLKSHFVNHFNPTRERDVFTSSFWGWLRSVVIWLP